jgi:hypothetical protein
VCSGTYTTEKSVAVEQKNTAFLFQVFELLFLTIIFNLKAVSGSGSASESKLHFRIRPKLSDSFEFGSATLVHSDFNVFPENTLLYRHIPVVRYVLRIPNSTDFFLTISTHGLFRGTFNIFNQIFR